MPSIGADMAPFQMPVFLRLGLGLPVGTFPSDLIAVHFY